MKITHGNYQVTRFCCTSGNCTECLARWVKERRKRFVHMDKLSQKTAQEVARNWSAYGASVEKMPLREGVA